MSVVDWAAWNLWNRAPSDPIVYEHTSIDLGAILAFTPLVSVTTIGGGTPTITEAHSDDDISYTNFVAVGPLIEARYFKIRVSVTDPTRAVIDNILIIADASVLVEEQSDIDMSTLVDGGGGAGDRRVALAKSFSVITSVQVVLQNIAAGFSFVLIDKSTALGPRFKIYDQTDTLVDVSSIDIIIRGVA